MKQQNIYSNKEFFKGYQSLRDSLSANELIGMGTKSYRYRFINYMINEVIKNSNSDKIEYKVMSMNDIDKLNEKFDMIVSSLVIKITD